MQKTINKKSVPVQITGNIPFLEKLYKFSVNDSNTASCFLIQLLFWIIGHFHKRYKLKLSLAFRFRYL